MDAPIPGFFPPGRPPIWWFVFHQTPDVPEGLVQGKELTYLSWFYHNLAYDPSAITQADINDNNDNYSGSAGMFLVMEASTTSTVAITIASHPFIFYEPTES